MTPPRKTIQLTEDAHARIVEAARKCGFRVGRGHQSQLAAFVEEACLSYSVADGEEPEFMKTLQELAPKQAREVRKYIRALRAQVDRAMNEEGDPVPDPEWKAREKRIAKKLARNEVLEMPSMTKKKSGNGR